MTSNAGEKAGRVWFVTGATSGFGRAVSEAVLGNGDRLAATGRDLEAINALIGQRTERALALRLDVTDAEAVRKAIDEAVARFGRLDVVFNNAGYGHVGAIEELTDDEWRQQIDVNLFGLINVTRAALPRMRAQRSGHLVQMSSLNGVEGLVGGGFYATSKFAIEGFSESLAGEVAHLGIKVTIVEPGPFRTRFLNGKSAKSTKPSPDYAESVGKAREMFRKMDGAQAGDPARAARAIVQAVEAKQPPLRLPLGRMALEHIRAALGAELKELEAWAELGAATDFRSDDQPQSKVESGEPRKEELVRRAYAAFNNRQIEAGIGLMDTDVDWPNVPQGGFVHGREQVRKHWREQFGHADPRIEIADIQERSDGRVEARVRQIVRRLDGAKLSDDQLVHVFTIANHRIKRLEIKPSR